MRELKGYLREYFGYTEFRPGQREIIEALTEGRDALAILPTGGGKSICYQLPALCMRGMAIVISPLIALMKDQIDTLRQNGIPAAAITSAMQQGEAAAVYRACAAGQIKLLYVAPERLDAPSFVGLIDRLTGYDDGYISLVAVDEAHCISQWGHDFRPAYVMIADFIARLPKRPPVLACTATATVQVREDIKRSLILREPFEYIGSFDRPNLYFGVVHSQNRAKWIASYVKNHPMAGGIVYCSTRKGVEKLTAQLSEAGVSVVGYHAGMPPEVRNRAQEEFIYERVQVVVATNAFGMGIDRSDVRFVIHMNLPASPEAYYQEAGRAGRDGMEADCILLYATSDLTVRRYLIESGEGDAAIKAIHYKQLEAMQAYAECPNCLRTYLLAYFGEPLRSENCGNCSNCRLAGGMRDCSVEAQKLLSCVLRMGGHADRGDLMDVLTGNKYSAAAKAYDGLSTWGIFKSGGRDYCKKLIALAVSTGILEKKEGKLSPTPTGIEVVKGHQHWLCPFSALKTDRSGYVQSDEAKAAAKHSKQQTAERLSDEELYRRLYDLRNEIALEESVPPHSVLYSITLRDLVARRPTTRADLSIVMGMTKRKITRYGNRILEVINNTR